MEQYLEFLFVNVGEDELDDVVRQGLHLTIYAEPVPVHLLVLLSLLEIQRVESFRNGVFLTQGLFARHHRETFLGAEAYNQQLMLKFFRRVNTVDLSRLKNHAILPGKIAKLKPLLTDTLDAVGTGE